MPFHHRMNSVPVPWSVQTDCYIYDASSQGIGANGGGQNTHGNVIKHQ